jgi:hypothetical protein
MGRAQASTPRAPTLARSPRKSVLDDFRAAGVVNSWEFYGHGRPYISYVSGGGRGQLSSRVQVVRPGYRTDTSANAHFLDNGHKTFELYHHPGTTSERKTAAIAEAQTWAGARYGISEWARDPFGSYGEAAFVKERVHELKVKAAEIVNAATREKKLEELTQLSEELPGGYV